VETLPASWYRDPEAYGREREAVFSRAWVYLGHRQHLRRTGDYVADEVAGWPVFVVVDDDGALRGYHNVCAHRAGPIVWDGTGSCAMTCRYHGWTYRFDGGLLAARDFGGDESALRDAGLTTVAVAEWRGLVFVNLSENAAPLAEWLGSFPEVCARFPMEDYVHHHRAGHPVRANWKTYADNYLEGYHIPLVHPTLNRAVDARAYEVTVHDGGRLHRHRAPARDGAPTLGEWAYLWPNLALNLYPDGMSIERFVPRGPARVDVTLDYFFVDGVSEREAQASVASSNVVIAEDVAICEAVQRNLDAGRYRAGRLSPKHELGLGAFQRLIREALGAPTAG